MKRLKLAELTEQARYLRMLVYGEPGAGKSWFCASACLAEETSPVLYVEHLGQVTSLRSNPAYMEALEDGRLVILQIATYKELNKVFQFLTTGQGALKGMMDTPKTVVIDSVTELQRREVLRIAGNNADAFKVEIEGPQIQHWGSLLSQFTLLAKMFYGLPMHVVFSLLETAQLNDKEKVVSVRPALQGSASRLLPAYALMLMRLERAARNVKAHAVGHINSSVARSKDQTGSLPGTIAGPTIPMLVSLLNKSLD